VSKAKKVTLAIPEDTLEKLKTLAENSAMSMSSAATASIEYFTWFINQTNDENLKIILTDGKIEKEVILPSYKMK
jgi:hypothetical protein